MVAPAPASSRRPFDASWLNDFLPHYLTSAGSAMHAEMIGTLGGLSEHRGSRINRIAPRGSAKSTLASKAYPLWAAVEGREPFALLLSDTEEQACSFLAAIKEELEGNETLRAAYPHAAGVGPVWKGAKVRLRNGCMIAAKGAGGRIRGLTNGTRRPTLIVVDDANKKEDAYSPTLRRRALDWVAKDVMPAGEPGHTNFVAVGTAVHREAVVCDLARNPTWETVAYKAIRVFPDRMDLWAEWERILFNLADPDREEAADGYHAEHRADMDAGGELLWPERFPLDFLMKERASLGASAFDSEYQDTPGTAGATEWPADYFDRPDIWLAEWPDDLAGKAFYLDPSKGEGAKAGDYQAHCWGGWSRKLNALCIEADLRREPTTDMVARAIATAQAFGCPVTAETNGTMGLLMAEFERQSAGRMVGLQGIANTDAKLQRIRTLGPFLARGQVKIRPTPGGRMMVDQLRDVPGGEYDDGPDAASGLLRRVLTNLNGGR